MRKIICTIILFCLIASSEFVFGKDTNKAKTQKANKNHNHLKDKSNIERIKRSLDEEDEKPFWATRGKKQYGNPNYNRRNDNNQENISKILKERDMEDEPFWGTRGRRDSSSLENHVDEEYPDNVPNDSNCNDCYGTIHRFSNRDPNFKSSTDDSSEPFWGVRGRRDSNEVDDSAEPFWGVRGRRDSNEVDDSADPFWGNRGRRQDKDPFWGAHGRRNDDPFWGSRGRRDSEPFSGKTDSEPFWGNRGRRDNEPFWGSRGRREEIEPFWGNRGRRDDELFWDAPGRRNEDVFWGARGRRREGLKESILSAINNLGNDIEHFSPLKKRESSFWTNRGRESKLKYLFSGSRRIQAPQVNRHMNFKNKDPATMTDSRIYAEEPQYILVERSSRSSGEADDPFVITRGKKYLDYKLVKAARNRRGTLEEIVKSVRNDPYFIARGKKDSAGNVTSTIGELSKAKELICSTVDLINETKEIGKVKREIDSDRERRTILKKLTAQLQNDPYFVSRGKKSDANNDELLREFIIEIAKKC